jgi:hypothetical protein
LWALNSIIRAQVRGFFIDGAAATAIDPVTSLTLVLAALAVLLTALAIIIGIAAVWGYLGIKEDARRIATEAAHKKLVEYFENESLKDKIRTMMASSTSASPVAASEISQPGDTGDIYTGTEDQDHASDDDSEAK